MCVRRHFSLLLRSARGRTQPLRFSLALLGAVACGDGAAGEGTTNEMNDAEGDDVFVGQVVNSTQITEGLAGIKLRFFNVETGELYPGEHTSGNNGNFSAERPPGSGTFAAGNGDWSDTWNVPPSRKGEEKYIRVSSAQSASIVPAIANYENDLESSALAGSVLWRNPSTGQDELVGCATIDQTEVTKDTRYFAGNLPASLVQRSLEQGTVPPNGMGTNDAEAGKFFIANLAAGQQTVSASVRGEVVGKVTLVVVPRKQGSIVNSTGMPSNVMLANIFVDASFTSNPTPADCK